MASALPKGFSTAYKRTRSQDSLTTLASPPVLKATKLEDEAIQDPSSLPGFLRQSQNEIRVKFNDLAWKEKFRIHQGRLDPDSQWAQDIGPQINKRNRYANVQPWSKSRVHLKVLEGGSDYINASPISLRDPRTGVDTNYIATQGPKVNGLSHFWHMIWQETGDVAVIVMLTQTHDGFVEKCYQYFPLSAEAGAYYVEPIDKESVGLEGSVTFLETVSDPDSKTEIRRLSLRFGDDAKEIWHFLYAGWPDFAVPEDDDRAALLELVKHSAERNSSPSNPRIIHCSAGVGRSGTFIALEYLLAQIESGAMADAREGEDLIYDVVNRLREQRMLMVQMDIQYEFLYDVVKEQFIKWQRKLAVQTGSTQHSPKLRKLASGEKSAITGEGNDKEDEHSANEETDGSCQADGTEGDDAKTTRSRGESQVEERRREGQAPKVK